VKKIVILGALGYIGSALIDLYRPDDDCEIYLVDIRFIPDRLANLPSKYKYIEGDILDADLMRPLLKDAHTVYLLAAEVEAEKSIDKGALVWRNNYEGALNAINLCSDDTRIVFASTGNVFGGVKEDSKNTFLTEEDTPQPKYDYAETKVAVEKYLHEHKSNYSICRFGTNYGYAPGIRFNLVTNIFTKKVLTGQNLTVHGTGDNYRPTCHVQDAARATKFLAESAEAKGETYHIVSANYRIRELAAKIASYNPDIEIEFIVKEVPFSGYHLSSEKIQKLGFEFKWDLETAVKEMAEVFSSIVKGQPKLAGL